MKALRPQTYSHQHYTFTHSGEVNMKSQFNLIVYFLITQFWSFLFSCFFFFFLVFHQTLKA